MYKPTKKAHICHELKRLFFEKKVQKIKILQYPPNVPLIPIEVMHVTQNNFRDWILLLNTPSLL